MAYNYTSRLSVRTIRIHTGDENPNPDPPEAYHHLETHVHELGVAPVVESTTLDVLITQFWYRIQHNVDIFQSISILCKMAVRATIGVR